MKGMRKLLAAVVVTAMLLTLVPAVALAAETDTVGGTFTINDPPTITYVKLYNTEGTPAEVTAMTPQLEYDARVKVADADGLTDLTTIVVKIYYDNTTEGTNKTEYDGKSADTQNCAIITWTEGGTFVLSEMTGTSWVLGTGVAPGTLADEFQFKFTVGKVATEAAGGEADDWQIAAEVTDDAIQTSWAADSDGSTMAWYGEVDVPDSTTVSWSTVGAGLNFGEDTASEQATGVTITYTSNGPYDEKVSTTATWSGVSNTATLDSDTSGSTIDPQCSTAQYFALKADDTVTLPGTALGVVSTAGVIIDDSGTKTVETGNEEANNTLWLKLASTFATDTYTGTITYTIADGS